MPISRRTFIQGLGATALAGVAGASLVAYGVDTRNVETKFMPLKLGLASPRRVVVMGDIHFDPLYDEAYLASVVKQVSALNADVVVFTGDFITYSLSRMHDVARYLGTIKARTGLVAILGNHDMWWGAGVVTHELTRNGIEVLRNASWALPGEDEVYFTGLESYWSGHPDPTVVVNSPSHARHILLVHEPDPFLELDDPRIMLQISGHTHGGQVRIPGMGAVCLPRWGKQYQEGFFAQAHRQLYVNRGVGTIKPHIRLNCRPEITVFELT